MKLLKYILIILTTGLFLCLPISANPPFSEPEVSASSGFYGENLTWTLSEDGFLTVSGSGPMADLPYEERWTDLVKKDVVKVRIESGITHIGNGAFSGFSSLKSVSMANTVTSIGDYAFDFCEALEFIRLSDHIVTVGSYIFRRCSELESIVLPDGITEIGEQTFYNCSKLKTVTFPKKLSSIASYAFYQCTNLKTLILPDALETIGDWAFSYCSGLKDINIPQSTISIGTSAFAQCTALESAYLPYGPLNIGNSAFSQCVNLKAVRFAYTLPPEDHQTTTIGANVFSGCRSLLDITLPYGITAIGESTFKDCLSLQTAVLPYSLKKLSAGLFENCTSLESIVIPKGVEIISSVVFEKCIALSHVTLPDTVTELGWNAFKDCTALTAVTIPDSVTVLQGAVFNSCISLKTITVYAKNTHIEQGYMGHFHGGAPENVLYRCYEGSTLHTYAMEHNLNYEFLTDWDTVFTDVHADDAAYSAICHMADRGIVVGTSETTFSPDMPLTRAMFVTLLGRMADVDVSSYAAPMFDDVPTDTWYAPYAAWAADEGIILGIGDNCFGGDLPIDIQQACLILVRCCGYQIVSYSGKYANTFPDYGELPLWSANGICWAVKNGLYSGKNELLCPDAPLTRAETAELLSCYSLLFYGK